jgi:hypothetical protein
MALGFLLVAGLALSAAKGWSGGATMTRGTRVSRGELDVRRRGMGLEITGLANPEAER